MGGDLSFAVFESGDGPESPFGEREYKDELPEDELRLSPDSFDVPPSHLGLVGQDSLEWVIEGFVSLIASLYPPEEHDGEEPLFTQRGPDPLIKAYQQSAVIVGQRNQEELNDALLECIENGGALTEIEALLSEGADINATDRYGRTPLVRAVNGGSRALVELLVNTEGVDLNQADKYGLSPLLYAMAVINPDLVKVKLLVTAGADLNQADRYGRTPLMRAVVNNNTEVVELLVNTEGVDLNQADNNGSSALNCALWKSYAKLARLLVNCGAKIDYNCLSHINCLFTEEVRRDLLSLIITRERFESIILGATRLWPDPKAKAIEYYWGLLGNLFELVKWHDIEIDLNTPNDQGKRLLELALEQGELPLFEVLFNSGYPFDLNIRDEDGKTIIDLAMDNGHEEIALYLKEQRNAHTSFLRRVAESLWNQFVTPPKTDDPFGQVPTVIIEDVPEEGKPEVHILQHFLVR